MMMNVLIVDGYNMIAAWEELIKLKEIDLGQARDHLINLMARAWEELIKLKEIDLGQACDHLINLMADYQAYQGIRVIVVFDAHFVPGVENKEKTYKIDIIYTKENETADECIEKLVTNYKNVTNQVYVATSDYMEQRITFGRGALRKSARELYNEIKDMEREIAEDIDYQQKKQPQTKVLIQKDVLQIFEKWRRGR